MLGQVGYVRPRLRSTWHRILDGAKATLCGETITAGADRVKSYPFQEPNAAPPTICEPCQYAATSPPLESPC